MLAKYSHRLAIRGVFFIERCNLKCINRIYIQYLYFIDRYIYIYIYLIFLGKLMKQLKNFEC